MIEGSDVDVFISKYGRKKYREIRDFSISHSQFRGKEMREYNAFYVTNADN